MDVKINKIVNLFNKKLFKEALAEIEIFFQGKSFLNEDSNRLAIIYNIKGLIYLSLDILNKSKESFIEAIRLNPDFYPAFYNLGITYFNLSQYENSIKNYQKAIDIKPDYPEAYNGIGVVLMHQQKIEEAIKEFIKALKYNPGQKHAYSNLIKSLSRVKSVSNETNVFVNTNKKLKKLKFIYNSTYKILDEDIKKFIKKSFEIIPKYIMNLDLDDEQTYRENTVDLNCKRHVAVFNKYNVIPENCFGCYKVLIEPKNVVDLIKLYLIFDNLKLDKNYHRKCMIEMRPNIKGCYKGYIFCSSKKEAQTIFDNISKILKKTINENILTSIKRGCSEFAEVYPNYNEINDDKKTLKYNLNWKKKENEIDNNYPRFAKIKNYRRTVNGISIHDILTIRNWLVYSKHINDKSYKKITNSDFNSVTIEKKLVEQIQFRTKQYNILSKL